MKDAVITVRVPLATRLQIEALACQEGRSLSQQVERLVTEGLAHAGAVSGARSLSGVLAGPAPNLAEFRRLRRDVSRSLHRARRRP